MDSLDKVFKAKGLDQSHPEIYAKIVHFRDVLLEDPSNGSLNKVSKNKFLKPLVVSAALIATLTGGAVFMKNRKNSTKNRNENFAKQNPSLVTTKTNQLDKFLNA